MFKSNSSIKISPAQRVTYVSKISFKRDFEVIMSVICCDCSREIKYDITHCCVFNHDKVTINLIDLGDKECKCLNEYNLFKSLCYNNKTDWSSIEYDNKRNTVTIIGSSNNALVTESLNSLVADRVVYFPHPLTLQLTTESKSDLTEQSKPPIQIKKELYMLRVDLREAKGGCGSINSFSTMGYKFGPVGYINERFNTYEDACFYFNCNRGNLRKIDECGGTSDWHHTTGLRCAVCKEELMEGIIYTIEQICTEVKKNIFQLSDRDDDSYGRGNDTDSSSND